MLKDLAFDEQRKEIKKPIYKECAQRLWDACLKEYKRPDLASRIAFLIVEMLECESRGDIKGEILLLTNNPSKDYLKEYLSLYSEHFLHKTIDATRESLFDFARLLPVLLVVEDSINQLDGKDYYHLINGGYFDEGPWYLSECISYTCKKTLVRVVSNGAIKWEIKSADGSVVPLHDVVCAWDSIHDDFFRFLDCHGRWGFIDCSTLERYYMPTRFYSIGDLCYDKAWFYTKDDLIGEGYGYCNYKGEIVVPVKFSHAEDYKNNKGKVTARVQYLYEYGPKYAYSQKLRTICGDPVETGITALAGEIFIDEDGHHLQEYEDLFRKQRADYYSKVSLSDLSDEELHGLFDF